MFYYVKGRLARLGTDFAAVECGGVCFRLCISGSTYAELSRLQDREALLYTYMNVREDEIALYGFFTEEERELFRLLITVSGIGPKAACSVLTALSPQELAAAIDAGDARLISRAQGVGLKTAQKIVLELGNKLPKGFSAVCRSGGASPLDADALDALLVLGYSRDEALSALREVDPALSLEEKIAEALKRLSVI